MSNTSLCLCNLCVVRRSRQQLAKETGETLDPILNDYTDPATQLKQWAEALRGVWLSED